MEEQSMSKYQRKQLAKARGTWKQPEAQVALSIIANFERRDAEKRNPPPPKPKKPKQEPPAPKGLIHPLGDLPERIAAAWRTFVTLSIWNFRPSSQVISVGRMLPSASKLAFTGT